MIQLRVLWPKVVDGDSGVYASFELEQACRAHLHVTESFVEGVGMRRAHRPERNAPREMVQP